MKTEKYTILTQHHDKPYFEPSFHEMYQNPAMDEEPSIWRQYPKLVPITAGILFLIACLAVMGFQFMQEIVSRNTWLILVPAFDFVGLATYALYRAALQRNEWLKEWEIKRNAPPVTPYVEPKLARVSMDRATRINVATSKNASNDEIELRFQKINGRDAAQIFLITKTHTALQTVTFRDNGEEYIYDSGYTEEATAKYVTTRIFHDQGLNIEDIRHILNGGYNDFIKQTSPSPTPEEKLNKAKSPRKYLN